MRLKQFIFALVAMLSLTFSAFAQTVTTEADLKAALQNGGEVTLGASITVSSPVLIPNDAVVVLNLNGKTLKATNAKTKVLENQGKLTINGQGTVSGIIYNGTANGSAAEMTLNGGTYSLDGNSGGLHHYGKTLTINDGVVVKTTSYGVRMAGKGSVLNLNGGTYTSTGSGDMARPLALSNGTVNFLDSDITVNGYMHVMVGQVTVNFGENNQYSPFEAYHQSNSYASSVFYCKTLAEAISRTDFAAVTLVKNVKVADGAPLVVNKNLNLNLNGYNISAPAAKNPVLQNFAVMTIKGKGTVKGAIYNGTSSTKDVAELTLDGGTYQLDGTNGGIFHYGKTLTINDGVTVKTSMYGVRVSNKNSVLNVNGGKFVGSSELFNMQRAITVDAGTVNFNDGDVDYTGVLYANRTNATINFGESNIFDVQYSEPKSAALYYAPKFDAALAYAKAGSTLTLQKNIERSEILTLDKAITLDGNGKTLTSTAGRAINVDCADVVTIENLTIAGATGCERGINIINKAGITNIDKVKVSGVSHYAVHVATSAGAAQVNIQNSDLTGYAAVAAYGEGGNVSVKNSNLVGINNYADNGSNSFSTIAVGSNVNVNVAGGSVKAVSQEGNGGQFVLGATADVTGASITADAELITEGTAEYFGININKNTVTVRKAYAGDYVTNDAGNGLVTLKAGVVAQIGNAKYATLPAAISAAKAGETVTLLADVNLGNVTSSLSIKNGVVVDGQGYTVTINSVNESWNKAAFAPSGPFSYTIKNLTVDLKNAADGMAAFSLKYGGTLENVTVKGAFGQAVSATMSSTVTVTNCAFDGATWGVYASASSVKVNVTGTAFNTTGAVYLHKYGELVFTGNMIAADSYIETEATVDVSKNFWNGNNATGSAPAAAQLKGGNIICDTYYATNSNGVLGSLTNNGVAEDAVINIEIDGETYAYGPSRLSLISKLLGSDAQGANVKITLLDDVALENGLQIAPYIESVDNIVAKAVEIDLNGKTLTGFIQINANVTATIQNGTVKNTNGSHSAIDVSGAVTLDKMTVESTTKAFKVADGATLAVKEGTYSSDPTSYVAENYVTVANNGVWNVVNAVAKIDDKGYITLEEAFAAATEGQTITMLDDATPALTSQRAITKAAVIDLGGKTMTLTEDDLYFGTTTFKNGTIVVDPSVKASTAVFWMFANQTLTFDNVKIVATGVTGTYLIGLEGENSHLNLINGSSIIIENTENKDFIVIAHNGNGNIEVNNSTIDIKNVGRGFLKGNITISGTSEVNLKDISKAGFRIEAGQTLAIKDESKVTIEGALRDGGINLVGTTASYTKAETATVNATVTETGFEAKIGDVKYTTFNEAVAAAQDGAEVTIHKAGTYNVPSGKNLTITGAVEGVKFANIGAHNMGGASMTFNNVTFEYGNENYKGLQHAGNLVYNNCTFNGQVFLYGQSETFNKCTFNQTSADVYNVWTYGAKEVAFNECTFNSAGKSVLIYHEDASMFNNVAVTNSTFNASQAVEGKAAIEMDASLTAGINLTIDDTTTATGFGAGNVSGNSLWNNKKGNADEANNDITVVVAGETVLAPVFDAKIGEKGYRNLQDAINAVKDGETVVLAQDFTGNITLTEKVGLRYTIDGAGKTMNGKITITPLSDENDNRRITIKGINFVNTADAAVDFISCAVTNHYPRLTVEGCTFTGNGKNTDVALRLKTAYGAVIKDCTGTGLHSFLQNTAGKSLTIEGVTVTESKGAFALGTVQGVTIKGSTIDVATYGIRLDANTYNNNATIESNNVTAFIPVVVRKVNAESNVTFTGENTFTAKNTDGKWMVIGTTEYEENGKLPAEVATGNVVVALNGTNLSYDGVHGAGLAGKGTAEAPYLINNVAELEIFRNSVNAGSTKYNAPGVWVALGADIDLANAEWTVGIGDGHNYSFDGNFDGKNHTIKNLNIKPYADADSYICGGLFGYTYGAVTIKNLVIENAIVNFATPETGKTYHNVGVLVGFANNKDGKLNVDNVIVKGDIKVDAPQTFGVGAIVGYSYREMGAITNTKVLANAGSYIKGERFVGGITGYSYNNAIIDNCTVENLALTGEIGVGGIAGLALNGNNISKCTVKDVTVNGDKNVAYVVGELGSGDGGNVTVADNNAPQPWVGGSYGTGESFVATIGTKYYTSIAKAIEAAKETDVITLIIDVTATEPIAIPTGKKVTLDLNGKTITGTDNETKSYGLININPGAELTINDATGNGAIKLTATNNREWNAYSSVISNQRGKLTVNGGTIEHLGGTAMAYAIDNLTNTGAQKAETIINGGTIKSTYRAIRQFLNSTSAENILTVNGGTIEGVNKSIWMQDANKYANPGALTVARDAAIKGDVYLTVTAGSTEWPVEVAVAAAALQGESKVLDNGNVPAGYDLAEVNGTYGIYTGVAKIGTAYYETLKAAVEAAQAGDTITLIDNVEATEVILLGKSLTINGNGYKVTSNATRVFRVTTANTQVTLNDVNMVSRTVMVYPNDIRGISIDAGLQKVELTLNNCSVDFTDATACDWAYAVNVSGNGTDHTVTVNGGTYEGANVINVHGANNTVVVKDATLTSLYPNNAQYFGNCIWVLQNQSSSVEATGNTFNGDNAIAFNLGTGTALTASDNIDNTKYVVAMIGDAYYTSIQDAIEAAQDGETVKLTQNVTIDELVKLEKAITLDLNDKKVTSTAMKAFEVYANATIKNGTIEAVQRCVDTRKAVELTLTDVTLIADKYTSYGNPQPLTIGGYENGTKVTMTNVNISADDGYGIITFVKTELTATNSTIAGYSALYVKPGSDNSVFNFTKSALSGSNAGNDVEGNSFSTIAVRANNVTVNVDAASTVTAVGNYCDAMSFGGNYAGEESVTDANVTIAGTINGNIMFAGLALNNNVISVKAEYADELATAGFVTSEADATGLVTIKDVTVLNEMTIEHSAYAGLEFVNENEKEVGTLNYVRNFSNTNWQAFYVPFAINYDDIKDDFDVARLNMAHQEEIDGKVQIKIEFISMKAGQTMKANYPYMIRPKQAGAYTFTVKNTTLKKAVSRSIDCSTVDVKFTFTGTYRTIFGDELVDNKYYYMGGGILGFTTNRTYKLNPFNWYMTMEGREDLSDVKFVFGGDFEDEETTGITNIDNDQKNDGNIYDLQGRRVLHPQKGSLYIVNGKKVVY